MLSCSAVALWRKAPLLELIPDVVPRRRRLNIVDKGAGAGLEVPAWGGIFCGTVLHLQVLNQVLSLPAWCSPLTISPSSSALSFPSPPGTCGLRRSPHSLRKQKVVPATITVTTRLSPTRSPLLSVIPTRSAERAARSGGICGSLPAQCYCNGRTTYLTAPEQINPRSRIRDQ